MKAEQRKKLRKELLDEALSESGIICFHAMDQHLTTALCDIIGALYRKLQACGLSEQEIEQHVIDD